MVLQLGEWDYDFVIVYLVQLCVWASIFCCMHIILWYHCWLTSLIFGYLLQTLVNGDTWARAVEHAIGRLLNAFIVTNHKDALLLRGCAREANYSHLQIVIYDFSRPRWMHAFIFWWIGGACCVMTDHVGSLFYVFLLLCGVGWIYHLTCFLKQVTQLLFLFYIQKTTLSLMCWWIW